jgi:hypothetical protein
VIPTPARHLPAVSQLCKYPPSADDDSIAFDIRCFFPERKPNRLLYIAETPGIDNNKQLILVKFAKRYSIELHEFCAKAGHAPPILGFETLPGGWCAVAMEYIESSVPISRSSVLSDHRDRWITELEDLVDGFHEKDLVHGDLQDENIICKGPSMMLVDFDWGGKEEEAFYFMPSLDDELMQGREPGDLRIRKEDDKWVLRKTLDKLMERM